MSVLLSCRYIIGHTVIFQHLSLQVIAMLTSRRTISNFGDSPNGQRTGTPPERTATGDNAVQHPRACDPQPQETGGASRARNGVVGYLRVLVTDFRAKCIWRAAPITPDLATYICTTGSPLTYHHESESTRAIQFNDPYLLLLFTASISRRRTPRESYRSNW